MEQSVLAPILVGCAVLLVAAGALMRLLANAHQERLRHFVGHFRDEGSPVGVEQPHTHWREDLTRRLNRYLSHRDFVQATRIDLLRAGMEIQPSRFFILRVALGLTGAALGWLLLSGSGVVQLVGMLAGLGGGYMAVRPVVGLKKQKRLDTFEKHFADALDVMVGGLEAGSSLTATVEMVSREMPAPISTEFSRVLRDARLGVPYEDAFNAMYERLPSDDLGMFVSALTVQFRVGGNLASVLRTLGATVRDRFRIRGDIKTLTAQQRLSGYLVTAIPFVIVGVLLLMDRPYMGEIFHPGIARIMAMIGVVMIFIGNVAIRKILRIEV